MMNFAKHYPQHLQGQSFGPRLSLGRLLFLLAMGDLWGEVSQPNFSRDNSKSESDSEDRTTFQIVVP